jgi:hypothetical protein
MDALLYRVYEVLVAIYNRLGAVIDALEERLGLAEATPGDVFGEDEYTEVKAA